MIMFRDKTERRGGRQGHRSRPRSPAAWAASPMTAVARELGYVWLRCRRWHQARARWYHYRTRLSATHVIPPRGQKGSRQRLPPRAWPWCTRPSKPRLARSQWEYGLSGGTGRTTGSPPRLIARPECRVILSSRVRGRAKCAPPARSQAKVRVATGFKPFRPDIKCVVD
jgi:hypothetical protein